MLHRVKYINIVKYVLWEKHLYLYSYADVAYVLYCSHEVRREQILLLILYRKTGMLQQQLAARSHLLTPVGR